MSAHLVSRLCRLAGVAPPARVVARTLARCPRPRIVRAVAWLASSTRSSAAMQLSGVRFIVRGWDDVYTTLDVPRDARRVDVESPVAHSALVIRTERIGRGWVKEQLPSVGIVRPETELAVAWLSARVGCVLHEDCEACPELGAACFEAHH